MGGVIGAGIAAVIRVLLALLLITAFVLIVFNAIVGNWGGAAVLLVVSTFIGGAGFYIANRMSS